MAKITRRDFSIAVFGTALAGSIAPAATAMPTRPLGKTGYNASIIGIGAQRLADRPLAQSTIDRIIAEAIDNGLNYIDTARGYGRSEELLGKAWHGQRDKVFLVSKTRSPTRAEAMKDVEESLRLLKTDHIDCYHIHNFGRSERFPDADATLSEDGTLGALLEAKKQGKILHVGATSHMRPKRVLQAFSTGEIEVFMCQLNFVERHSYNFEDKVLPEARRRGIAVIGMKVLGGPTSGTTVPRLSSKADYQATLRYVWGTPGVAVAIVGMRSLDELRQGLATARQYQPLSEAELAGLSTRGQAMAKQWGELRGPFA